MEETGWSPRGLSAAAGLGPDAVRNVVRGLSATLRGDRLERIAAILGVPAAALVGEKPWPRKRLR
ncbi:MAG: helix-turn-helix domain-containing protein, partial [Janthinobacterium lividum]